MLTAAQGSVPAHLVSIVYSVDYRYLILFAPPRFAPHRQLPSSYPPSPLVFFCYIYAFHRYTRNSDNLRYSRPSFKCSLRLSSPDFTSDLPPGCTPLHPVNPERLPPTHYRGCWHVVSRGLFVRYRLLLSLTKEVYNPESLLSLHGKRGADWRPLPNIPAASCRSLGRISVPMWPVNLSVRLLIVAMVGRYPTI